MGEKKITGVCCFCTAHEQRHSRRAVKPAQGAAEMCRYFYTFLLLMNASFLFIFPQGINHSKKIYSSKVVFCLNSACHLVTGHTRLAAWCITLNVLRAAPMTALNM